MSAHPTADPTHPADPLSRERSHLAASRSALRAMREDAEALDIKDVTANWVNAEVLARQIAERIKSLADLSHTPLFFGRLDYLHAPGADRAEGAAGERFYIGRRHVHDADGDPMVIDWRAPVSQPFYRASRTDPLDVGLRRRFGYTGGDLTAYEDEHLSDPAEAATTSKLLQQEIERPRVGPMRDIVATIQPEQDEIVRSDLAGSLCVQGGPGTGKTAVGLHRVAYLLYAHRERLARTGTLVIGPNRSFLHYIEQVLPALGELEVKQATVDDLVSHVEVRGTDEAPAAVVKGDARMAEVLRRAVRSHVTLPAEPVMVVRGSRRWRVPAYELEDIVRELLERDIRYGAAREALPQRIAHAVLVQMERSGEAPDDRVQDAVARNTAVKAAVKAMWPPVDPARLVLRLLSDADFLAAHADGILTGDEQKTILWAKPARSVKAARWSAADAVLVDEATDLVQRTHSLGHVVLDEAQDLSPMQYRAVGRRCTTGSATVLGDLAQGTTPWATRSWEEALTHLGKAEAHVEELTAGFRVPTDVITYASRLLPHIAPGLTPVASVRENPGFFDVRPSAGDAQVVAACEELLRNEGSTGLIAADARVPALAEALTAAGIGFLAPGEETTYETRLTLVPASLAKGLEYDYVVLDEPRAVVDGEPDERTGLRRLYVALTRAVSGLIVTHTGPLPEQLG
ncbi:MULTISPECIES: HelD family protein [Streptomyces]|uniref:Putative ATP/GTP binding protein n=9 Tax=Streptomyces scabiei TaxID=1930 RepID=C9YTG7_STRSW|nr:ATP-binding domain-containing protein [Streptomyces scabiei]MBP5862981.1 AAA family ATPase [Streptomyces sp. LBUM 1484]MBP5868086.1 AAA family ATPase [Streptomyces sp. LBUM 1485]MBP5876547.1 AAA family ATPase [Streptomyces sp. LBUM 1477]MBP5884303.1 AAA family ATPase [Streptomyces sp. LBUM 1487]MBP5892873.1 AAA family ATPase [Streptomyces sp. LBUM 1481]MBP5900320.1 AAA family ATPase [Streptomyces sp. LBUM 1488]MBP5906582.1 AAA family ATPase [Streptomyces sp. LBUM 1478]MBP5916096.1 AAA fa